MSTKQASQSATPPTETYADFLNRTYPGQVPFTVTEKDVENRDRNETTILEEYLDCFKIIDFSDDLKHRIFDKSMHRIGFPGGLSAYLEELRIFIRATPASSEGLVFFWNASNASRYDFPGFSHDTVLAALAEAVFAHPETAPQLAMWIHGRNHLNRNDGKELPIKHDWGVPLMHVWLKRSSIPYDLHSNQCSIVTLPLTSMGIFDLSAKCMLNGRKVPIYWMLSRQNTRRWLQEGLLSRAHTSSTPAIFVSSVLDVEHSMMISAMDGLLQLLCRRVIDLDICTVSCHLHLAIKVLIKDLKQWQIAQHAPAWLAGQVEKISALIEHMNWIEPDIRDAYQIYVDETTLIETRKSIQMAEMSIEMSKKSIRESERVRVLTVLAFVFLPISLASSIFGMNVKAISGDRTPISAFFITAGALIAGALCIWAGSSILMRYHKLTREVLEEIGTLSASGGIRIDSRNPRRTRVYMANTWYRRVAAAMISLWTRQDGLDILGDFGKRYETSFERGGERGD